jgi:hypothetical protein
LYARDVFNSFRQALIKLRHFSPFFLYYLSRILDKTSQIL